MADDVGAVRHFNRFYTNVIGVLRGGLLDTPYTLTEARVIFELAQHGPGRGIDVASLRQELDIDAGYLSRILGHFSTDGLVKRERSDTDGRRQVIALTPAGRTAYATLDERSAADIRTMLDKLPAGHRHRLLDAMGTIREVLAEEPRPRAYRLRPPDPGDLGWVVSRHGALYAQEYGWDGSFEATVARIVADYAADPDPAGEACWIADVGGVPAGSVFCVRQDDATAKLRLLLVEPSARGLGIGAALVDECLRFARRSRYRRITLWTNDVLVAARRIYERAGFQLGESEPHFSFGRDLVGQTWWLDL
jgi:DNA-binding MarR family transcriptional regulator/ribosomal protein S18 acetylase RimI-like enzyme